jgi:hypothetical protein
MEGLPTSSRRYPSRETDQLLSGATRKYAETDNGKIRVIHGANPASVWLFLSNSDQIVLLRPLLAANLKEKTGDDPEL